MKRTRIPAKQRDAILEAAIEVCYEYRRRFDRTLAEAQPGSFSYLVGPIDGSVVTLEKALLDSPLGFRLHS